MSYLEAAEYLKKIIHIIVCLVSLTEHKIDLKAKTIS
jgi:hypothetical protein